MSNHFTGLSLGPPLGDQRLDLCDLYAFTSPADPSRTVLILNANPQADFLHPDAIYRLAISGALWQHLSYSIMRIGAGWILGTVAGVIVGFSIGLSSLARGVGITFISALFPIPKIALLPLLILWLGIGEEPKIATIALGVFFSTAISVYSGVDQVPRNLIRMAQSFNVPFSTIVRHVIWPGALPSILAGFRITASVALLLVVSAEMIGAEFGIGAFVLQAGNLMQTDQLLAGVVILSLFGLAVGKLINMLETRLLHWR